MSSSEGARRKLLEFNLNDYVQFHPEYPEALKLARANFEEVGDGWFRGQLWEVMDMFQPRMGFNPVSANVKLEVV